MLALTLHRMSAVLALAGFVLACQRDPVQPVIVDLDALNSRLEALRSEYDIPALSAGIVKADRSTWLRGYGSTSATSDLPPTPQSIFHLASLTKTFASAIILQLAAEGALALDDNVAQYGIHFANSSDIRVRHLMSHTSEGTPGERFQYNGDRYAQLDKVIEGASGKTFAQLASERIIGPLNLSCTGPSTIPSLRAALVPGYNHNHQVIAYPTSFSSAAGMVSCMQDLLNYSIAWDSNMLLAENAKQSAWTAAVNSAHASLPHGLGWFVDELDGRKIVWHYGLWTGISTLIIKLPDQQITFVLLANNDQLSASFRLGAGDLRSSPFARAFLAWALQREIPA